MATGALVIDAAVLEVYVAVEAFIPAHWLPYIVVMDEHDLNNYHQVGRMHILSWSTNQPCCTDPTACLCNELIARLPEDCIAVGVLSRYELRCLARCIDCIVASPTITSWCCEQGIPSRRYTTISQAVSILIAYFRNRSYRRRYQAQLYRKHRLEVE